MKKERTKTLLEFKNETKKLQNNFLGSFILLLRDFLRNITHNLKNLLSICVYLIVFLVSGIVERLLKLAK